MTIQEDSEAYIIGKRMNTLEQLDSGLIVGVAIKPQDGGPSLL
jgi:hypothetical protein